MEAPNTSSSATQQLIQTTYSGLSRPLNPSEVELLSTLERLKHFLASAPSRWSSSSSSAASTSYGQGQQQQQASNHSSTLASLTTAPTHPALNRFLLPSGEYISCVLWSGLYHITGTDIVRALVYRFEAFGRPVTNMKKFEEGVFSDLRNLKPGTDACLEEPKSPFLDLLFKYQCIRTQKKQKVFYWFSVPHDRLFLDALERDLKREKMGLESTTTPRGEPAISFKYDPKKTLYEQFLKPLAPNANGGDADEEDELSSVTSPTGAFFNRAQASALSVISPADIMARKLQAGVSGSTVKQEEGDNASSNASAKNNGSASASSANKQMFTNMFSLFEGSPTYKQRRKKAAPPSKLNPEISRRRSTLASEVAAASLSRRSSNAALGEHSVAGSFAAQQQKVGNIQTHPSLVNNQRSDNMSQASSSRPQSQHASLHHGQEQQLPSYGLSMNLSVERPGTASTNDQRPITANSDALEYQQRAQDTTKAFVCPLYSCRRLFHRPETLRKHLSTHAMSAIIRSRASSLNTGAMGPGLKYPCDKPGCFKIFTRPDNLRLHQQSCNGWSGTPNSGMEDVESERAEGEAGADPMDLEADIQEVEVPANATFEDDEAVTHASSVSPPPPGSSHGHLNLNLSQLRASQFGVATTSAETSPFVETPDPHSHAVATPGWNAAHPQQHRPADIYTNERAYPDPLAGLTALNGPQLGPGMAQFAALHNGLGHHTLHHHMSHHNLGLHPSTPPPDSASSVRSGAVFGAQQNLHPRFHTPEYNAYAGYGHHPSSAPSHKVTFDHASLYPPNPHNGGMVGLSLRRHRSAAPTLSGGNAGGLRNAMDHPGLVQHQNLDSRPASSAGGDSNYDYGTVIVNPAAHGQQFAYNVEGGDANAIAYGPSGSVMYAAGGPGSDHSSPMSYGRVASGQGEYGDSNSPYDGSGASPGSAHNSEPHLAHVPIPQQAAYVGMRIHHGHSLSSEIATQQMQQYVDLDGLADDGDSYNPPPTGSTSYHSHTQSTATIQGQPTGTGTFQEATSLKYHDDGSDQNHSTSYMDVAYRSGGSESSHEDVYGYNQHPHDPQSIYTQTHQLDGYGYPSAAGQQIAL